MTSILSSTLSTLAPGLAAPVASSMPEGVRTALLALLGLLVVIFGCLIAFAFVLRKRPQIVASSTEEKPASDDAPGKADQKTASRAAQSARMRVRLVARDSKVCPACRREFESRLRFCPFDSIALIPAAQMLAREGRGAQATRRCPTCRRAFEGDLRFCPHDGTDLTDPAESRARSDAQLESDEADIEADDDFFHDLDHHDDDHRGDEREDDHESIKICPRCRGRYGFAATFCGKDGVELVVLN